MRTSSLLTKSMLWIVGSIMLVFAFASFLQWRKLREHTLRNLRADSYSLTSAVAAGLHNNMLKADHEGTQALLLKVGQLESVRRVFVLDEKGRIASASDTRLVGSLEAQADAARLGRGEKDLFEVHTDDKGRTFTNNLAPIPMEAACIQCHAEAKPGQALGYLGVERWSDTEFLEQAAMERTQLVTSLCIVLAVAMAIYILLRRVTTRLEKVSQVAAQVARGNVDQVIDFHSNDELGRLAASFRLMITYIRGIAEAA